MRSNPNRKTQEKLDIDDVYYQIPHKMEIPVNKSRKTKSRLMCNSSWIVAVRKKGAVTMDIGTSL